MNFLFPSLFIAQSLSPLKIYIFFCFCHAASIVDVLPKGNKKKTSRKNHKSVVISFIIFFFMWNYILYRLLPLFSSSSGLYFISNHHHHDHFFFVVGGATQTLPSYPLKRAFFPLLALFKIIFYSTILYLPIVILNWCDESG